jgi:hypothetical protein
MNQTTSPTSATIALDHLNQLQTTDGTLLMWAMENLTSVIDEMNDSGDVSDWKLIRLLDHTLRDLEAARGHIERATAALSGKTLTDQP